MATHAKLWLWALPRARLAVLDSDMVVRGRIDWMTSFPLAPGQIAAASVERGRRRFFNSGLLVIQPSAPLLQNLTSLARVARAGAAPKGDDGKAIERVGEKMFGDQSILNFYFQRKWLTLPSGIMGVAPAKVGVSSARVLAPDPAVLHWISEPKPWSLTSLHLDASSNCQRVSAMQHILRFLNKGPE